MAKSKLAGSLKAYDEKNYEKAKEEAEKPLSCKSPILAANLIMALYYLESQVSDIDKCIEHLEIFLKGYKDEVELDVYCLVARVVHDKVKKPGNMADENNIRLQSLFIQFCAKTIHAFADEHPPKGKSKDKRLSKHQLLIKWRDSVLHMLNSEQDSEVPHSALSQLTDVVERGLAFPEISTNLMPANFFVKIHEKLATTSIEKWLLVHVLIKRCHVVKAPNTLSLGSGEKNSAPGYNADEVKKKLLEALGTQQQAPTASMMLIIIMTASEFSVKLSETADALNTIVDRLQHVSDLEFVRFGLHYARYLHVMGEHDMGKQRYLDLVQNFSDLCQQDRFKSLHIYFNDKLTAQEKAVMQRCFSPEHERQYQEACDALQDVVTLFQDHHEAIETLANLARSGYEKATQKLIDLCQLGERLCLFAAIGLYRLVDEAESQDKQELLRLVYGHKLPSYKTKIKDKQTLQRHVIQLMEAAFNDEDHSPSRVAVHNEAFYHIGRLRHDGEIYTRNYFIALDCFKLALQIGDQRANFYLGKLFFLAQGTPLDLSQAQNYLAAYAQAFPDGEHVAEACYYLGEIAYAEYRIAKDDGNKAKEAEEQRRACDYYEKALAKGYGGQPITESNRALISLYLLRAEGSAEASAVIGDKGAAWPDINFHPTQSSSEDLGKAIEALAADNPEPLKRCLRHAEQAGSAIERLTVYYVNKQRRGFLMVLTTLCYVAKRHSPESAFVKNLNRLLNAVYEELPEVKQKFTVFAEVTPENITQYERQLQQAEQGDKTYYDEALSDISDDDDEVKRQETDRRQTRAKKDAREIIKKLEPSANKLLRELQDEDEAALADAQDKHPYQNWLNKIRAKFTELDVSVPAKHMDEQTLADITMLNFHKARGDLANGLKQIGDRYVVAFTRGHHFSTNKWSQRQRREMRRKIIDKTHPFVEEGWPVFSSMVYEYAGIADFSNHSLLTLVRLEKAALTLHWRYIQKIDTVMQADDNAHLVPYSSMDKIQAALVSRSQTHHFREQIQQLYTNDYDSFFEFVKFDAEQGHGLYPQGYHANPKVSFGRLGVYHANAYAGGTKYYTGQESARLRPRWDNDLRPQRRITGYVILGVFPLDDLVSEQPLDIVAMANCDAIRVGERILPEQEFAFDVAIKSDRIQYIDLFKYPAFNRGWLPIDRIKYYLAKETYNLFKRLFDENPPHSNKCRLAAFLLGSYLCAGQNFFLLQEALSIADAQGKVLLFLDRNGMFTLRPCRDILPAPSGHEEEKINRCHHARLIRKFSATLSSSTSGNSVQDADQERPAKIHRK